MTKGFHASHTGDLALERALQKARAILGLPRYVATGEEIKTAFAQMVKKYHPDGVEGMVRVVCDGHVLSPPSLQSIRDAKDLLLKHLKDVT